MFLWGILILLYRISLSYFYEEFQGNYYVSSLIIFIITLVYIFWPFKSFIYQIRLFSLKVFLRYAFPFGKNKVKFKEVMLGGVMTTLSRAYTSLSLSMCLFTCNICKKENIRDDCDKISLIPAYVLGTTAFLLRASQFFVLTYYKKQYWPHLVNAFRFITSAIFMTIAYLHSAGIILF